MEYDTDIRSIGDDVCGGTTDRVAVCLVSLEFPMIAELYVDSTTT